VPPVDQLIIGARPCDAAALPVLDRVFNWDYRDEFYNRRREGTTVVVLACKEHDGSCFCTTVGLGPDNGQGADAMLFDLGDGEFEVRTFTAKGERLFAGQTQTSAKIGTAAPPPESARSGTSQGVSGRGIRESRMENHDAPLPGLRGCAFNCPTCHCFDIADEGSSAGGSRVRNWDACQFGLYSQHASGHNPRDAQANGSGSGSITNSRLSRKIRRPALHRLRQLHALCPVALGVRPVLETIGKRS